MQSGKHDLAIQSLFLTGISQRLSAAAVFDFQLLKNRQGFGMLDDPIGDRRIKIARSHAASTLRNECPVFNPATKMTRATAPRKKIVSPGTRIQRSHCITSVCMNSGLRAYQ